MQLHGKYILEHFHSLLVNVTLFAEVFIIIIS